jgi:hypothetical protein
MKYRHLLVILALVSIVLNGVGMGATRSIGKHGNVPKHLPITPADETPSTLPDQDGSVGEEPGELECAWLGTLDLLTSPIAISRTDRRLFGTIGLGSAREMLVVFNRFLN